MKLRMKLTKPGSPDGMTVKTYRAGEVYSFTGRGELALAEVFVRAGWAEAVTPVRGPGGGGKDRGASPRNKARGRAPKNK